MANPIYGDSTSEYKGMTPEEKQSTQRAVIGLIIGIVLTVIAMVIAIYFCATTSTIRQDYLGNVRELSHAAFSVHPVLIGTVLIIVMGVFLGIKRANLKEQELLESKQQPPLNINPTDKK